MNTPLSPLKLQSYLDGELTPAEEQQIRDQLVADADAQALLSELAMTHRVLAGNETSHACPEGRDFYFSQVRQRIERAEKMEPRARAGFGLWHWIRGHFAATGGLALGTAVAVMLTLQMGLFQSKPASGDLLLGSVKAEADESVNYYRNDAEGVTMVWLSQN